MPLSTENDKTSPNVYYVYYNDRFEKYKHDIKNTWRTIKELITRKSPNNNFPDYFQIGDEREYDKATIAHKCNTYFASIGIELASAISNAGDITYNDFCKPLLQIGSLLSQ